MNAFLIACIVCKFVCGLIAIVLGVVNSDVNVLMFGVGHAFVLTPLWVWLCLPEIKNETA